MLAANSLAPPVVPLAGLPAALPVSGLPAPGVVTSPPVPAGVAALGKCKEATPVSPAATIAAVLPSPAPPVVAAEQPPAAAIQEAPEVKPTSSAAAATEASSPSPTAATVGTGVAADIAGPSSAANGGEGPPTLPEGATDAPHQPSLPSPTTPSGSAASPATRASPGGSESWKSEYVMPRTWANIAAAKDLAAEAGREASSSSAPPRKEEDARSRKDSIIDFLLLLARGKAEAVVGANGALELPEDLQKFKQATGTGMSTNGRAKYNRRGMKNDANNCYVNVVIQSLLPCSALMQLLSNVSNDNERPFYTGMWRLCKEFHSRRESEALNVLGLSQVKNIISTWQQLGAQQDAGEFLFHLLNGLHEECKWKIPEEGKPSAQESAGGGEAGEGEAAKSEQVRPDVRSAGDHEDSPIFRIFGGIIRSSVQAKNTKADSVSLEPFNGLILDISSTSVDSVWSALEAYCGTEAVNEGRATKRLQFKAVPKVMILNLKRFSYNKDTGCPQKIRKAVKFEEKLSFDRSWMVDELEPQEYQLTAVICHHGDLVSGGHYNCAVRYNTDWYMYDDVSVRQIDIREVVSQLAASVYLLLYQCQDRVDIRP